jgi:hypothetical protein
MANKPLLDACFNDLKRFCFVLREIASGRDDRRLSGFEAQTRAREVLSECGYTWLTRGPQRDAHPSRAVQQASVLCTIGDLVSERKHGQHKRATESTKLRADYPRSLRLRR